MRKHSANTPSPLAQEDVRRLAQSRLDARGDDSSKNRLGQVSTPFELAKAMLEISKLHFPSGSEVRFLDPAIGTGVFFSSLLQTYDPNRIQSAVGFEIDHAIGAAARQLWSESGLRVKLGDFTKTSPPPASERFNLVVCNPPYVRHHHLSPSTKQRIVSEIQGSIGIRPSQLSGLYLYFILLCHRWMSHNAIAVWLVPTEFLDVNYGEALRRYLIESVEFLKVHRFDPEDVQFPNALVSSSVLVFRKARPRPKSAVQFSFGGSLRSPIVTTYHEQNRLSPERKWRAEFGGSNEPAVAKRHITLTRLGDLFRITRGIATGANAFFILPRMEASDRGLPPRFLTPVLPGPRWLDVDVVNREPDGWPALDPQNALLTCSAPRGLVRQEYPALETYLSAGEDQGLNNRYLLRRRHPWYLQESRKAPPILCTYMGRRTNKGRVFRFIRNYSDAVATNVYLLLYPREAVLAQVDDIPAFLDEVFDELQKVPQASLISEGRSYGGGLNKMEPRELANLPLPGRIFQDSGEGPGKQLQLGL